MKRRRFLTAIGAGSVGAGALVGTGSYDTIRSQRRVKLEVDGEEIDRREISFVAFCIAIEDLEEGDTHEDFTITPDEFENDDLVGIEWDSGGIPVQTVVLKTGPEFFNFDVSGSTSGTNIVGNRGDGEEANDQRPQTPCGFDDGFCSVKFNWDGEAFEWDPGQDDCFDD
ncbi:hypothetical protein ACLI4R_16530 [Natrialbaceae archaeon A-chndr2]